jgi:hypothetical protein
MMGHGSANHLTYHLGAGGRFSEEYELLVWERLQSFAEQLPENYARGLEYNSEYNITLFLHAPSLSALGLAPLTDCTSGLDGIVLDNVQLGPGSTRILGRITSLKGLSLRNTGLSTEELHHLDGLAQLRYLNIRDNAISETTARAFMKSHPDCQVIW